MYTDMTSVGSIILGGGRGTRLFPLTATRCKPAISFGGRYRLIDVPISNSINSGIHKIFIISQFLSASLHKHLLQTYQFDRFSHGFLELLSAEQKPSQTAWYQGTADAVRQNLEYFLETDCQYFCILSGDQLYSIDFRDMLSHAQATDADLTIAALPVKEEECERMGVLKIDERQKITHFQEKPKVATALSSLRTPQTLFHTHNIPYTKGKDYLASMGIYLFKRKALFDLLTNNEGNDFGNHLIPAQIEKGRAYAYPHLGYWEDIGTIKSFYNANLALTTTPSQFDLFNESHRIYSAPYQLPGPQIANAHISNAILCEGTRFDGREVSNSILGIRSVVKKGCVIRNTLIIGNDSYTPPACERNNFHKEWLIDENVHIENAIIDKNVYIGKNVRLTNEKKYQTYDNNEIYVRDGITIVAKGAVIPDNFVF
ncbi:glucose-1-phosphate adenylyltransferase [Simkania negevensis]|uniref:Glucose-1-phosphate adenylyltransferase n=1 Tax=Simkania negevensis TaxID=83561 RepID=A0ABS3ARI8_9BACT|nr:glucose-1-phosphate adenylyltransferase [Simkania negevensis]